MRDDKKQVTWEVTFKGVRSFMTHSVDHPQVDGNGEYTSNVGGDGKNTDGEDLCLTFVTIEEEDAQHPCLTFAKIAHRMGNVLIPSDAVIYVKRVVPYSELRETLHDYAAEDEGNLNNAQANAGELHNLLGRVARNVMSTEERSQFKEMLTHYSSVLDDAETQLGQLVSFIEED